MPLHDGERQVATDLSEIRRDHTARYQWAARQFGPADTVVDFGCGIGYGSSILAGYAGKVFGLDDDQETIAFANAHWKRDNVEFVGAGEVIPADKVDGAIAFEVIEHIQDPRPMLRALRGNTDKLIASVPNEKIFPWKNYKFHFRHYTREQFEALLNETGWQVTEWWGQMGADSFVERDVEGRTLIAVCKKSNEATIREIKPARLDMHPGSHQGKHVVIIGLGPSAEAYMDHVKRMGSRAAFCDEVWGINAIGSVLDCDLVFHMDDVRVQAIRAEAKPQSNIANMLAWLKVSRIPVITSRAHPDYPALVEFPFESVVNVLGRVYFNNTAAYAIAYAIYCGVSKISLFGCDYTYPNAHKAEKGRANAEFWLGFAAAHGIEIALPEATSLMDSIVSDSAEDVYAYGYDTVKIKFDERDDGSMRFTFTEREKLPTADEIEASYDHGRPPVEQHMRKTA
jgi:SAM-dependent methyltransferase